MEHSAVFKRHPKWQAQNVTLVELAYKRDVLEGQKWELLSEKPCVKCGAEMGEHDLDSWPVTHPNKEN